MATGHRDNTAQLWDLSTGKPLLAGRGAEHAKAVTGVAVRPDGRVLVTGCRDGTAQAWDVASGLPLGPPWAHASPVGAVAWRAGEVFAWPVPSVPAAGDADELRARYGRLTNNTRALPPE